MKSKHQNEVNLNDSGNDDKIEKEREKLWKARQCVYDGIKNNNYVSWSVKIFRAKLKKFLKKFQNQITEDEKEFWKERLSITTSAVKTSNQKIQHLESSKVKIKVDDNLISSSLGEEVCDDMDKVKDVEKTIFEDLNQVKDQFEEDTNDENILCQNLFDNVRNYEDKCNRLPLPPSDYLPTDLDMEIEDKLLKLKFFNRLWLSDGTTVEETREDVDIRFDAIKSKNS